MKMIYVGSLSLLPDRDSSWIAAFKDIGCEVIQFSSTPKIKQSGLITKICRRLNIGYLNIKIQDELLALADRLKPDWVHFRLPLEFGRQTIEALKSKNIIVTQYFNDDPFSKLGPIGLHWKFLHALKSYDAHFVYRAHNVKSYINAGAKNVVHCPPAFDPRRHYISGLKRASSNYLADAAFIGHWENDWRVDCLEALADHGFEIIIKGGMWDSAIKNRRIARLLPIQTAFGSEYNYIYSNVVAGLCFFSKINNDTWTERALEIVAVGGVLVCERTAEAESYFKDREEAYFFSSVEELINIIKLLKTNFKVRKKVCAAGYSRLLRGNNTVNERAMHIYKHVKKINLTKKARQPLTIVKHRGK